MAGLCEGGNEPAVSLNGSKYKYSRDIKLVYKWKNDTFNIYKKNILRIMVQNISKCMFTVLFMLPSSPRRHVNSTFFLLSSESILLSVSGRCGAEYDIVPHIMRTAALVKLLTSETSERKLRDRIGKQIYCTGKEFSHEISVNVCDRCSPSIVMNLRSYDSISSLCLMYTLHGPFVNYSVFRISPDRWTTMTSRRSEIGTKLLEEGHDRMHRKSCPSEKLERIYREAMRPIRCSERGYITITAKIVFFRSVRFVR
ncbi:hypothetical protein ANN_20957 [Periplaneta americana]|uniref:Uncharacterized protein n=1 Tax=Periplaneta americana TaxID=6978 RepID=A0ABQ8SEH1_PERAM|nr:hypothetical protein ANN_20957 [Periplaneta americana]